MANDRFIRQQTEGEDGQTALGFVRLEFEIQN